MDVFKFKEPEGWTLRARSIESSTLHQVMSKLVNSDLSSADRDKIANELADRVWYLYHASATFHGALRRRMPELTGTTAGTTPCRVSGRRIVIR